MKYKCWSEEEGEEWSSKEFEAESPEGAAEEYADWADEDRKLIDDAMGVCVRLPNGDIKTYNVGATVIVDYNATEVKNG